jgi:hypothetical protein
MGYVTVLETPLEAHEAVGAILKRLQVPEIFGSTKQPRIMPDALVHKVVRPTETVTPEVAATRRALPLWHRPGPQPEWPRYLLPGQRVEIWQAKNRTDVWVTVDEADRVLRRVVIRGLRSMREAEDLRAEFKGRTAHTSDLERAVEAIVWAAGGPTGRTVEGIATLRKQLEDLTPDYADAAFNGWVRENLRPDPSGRGMAAADLYEDYRRFVRGFGENDGEKALSKVTTLSVKKWGSTMRGRFEARRDGHGARYPLLLKLEPRARKAATGPTSPG